MTGITGEKLHVLGTTTIPVANAGNIDFFVIKDSKHPLILGNDQLRMGSAIIDLNHGTLKWYMYFYDLIDLSSCNNISPSNCETEISKIVDNNRDLFADPTKSFDTGLCKLGSFQIDTGDSPPISQKPYRVPLTKRKIIEDEVKKMLDAGIITPSSSPWAAPVCLVPKKSGEVRFCVDYRKLNAVTRKDKYPLPFIQDIFDSLQGAKIFSTLDLFSGYWQIPVHPNSVDKTSFVCHLGTFAFNRMPFGCTNCPSVFQRILNKVLSDLIGKICFVYIDDICIFSRNEHEHAKHLQIVFDRLRHYGLKLKESKCHFGLKEIHLLGYVINEFGLRPNPDRVKAIKDLAAPKNLSAVRTFLGMTSYYRQCMPNYAKIAEPLVALTRKNSRFAWTEECENSFMKLKSVLVSDKVMAHPQPHRPYRLYCDACDYAIGGILVQTDPESGVEKVVQYVSKQLSGTQRRWATIEKEAFSVVYCLQKLRPYLLGAEFVVYTDHKPLLSLFTKSMNNTKIQRWSVLLAEYGARIKYREGKNNIRADMLSRIQSDDNDTEDCQITTIDTDDWFDTDILDHLPEYHVPLALDNLDKAQVRQEQITEYPTLRAEALCEDSSFELHDGILYSVRKPTPDSKIYPRLVLPSVFHDQVMKRAHKSVGHMSVHKTLECVRGSYVWPRMHASVKRFVSSCPLCTVHLRRRERTEMGTMPIATYPMQIIGVDLMGPFVPSENGNRYVLVVIDHCSGWCEAYPLPQKRSKCVFDALTRDFFPRHGFPEILISDNGREFTANEIRDYLDSVGVKHNITTPYHPQSNGKTERMVQTLKSILRRLLNGDRASWEDHLGDALMASRNAVSTVTGSTPFHLLYGRRCRLPLSRCIDHAPVDGVRPFGNRLYDLSVALNKAKALTEQSRRYNRDRLARKANAHHIEVGDTVIVAANEPLTLTAKWDPQFEVTRIVGSTCWLRHQRTGKELKVHREKIRLVDPNMVWDDVAERPRRNRQGQRARIIQDPDEAAPPGDANYRPHPAAAPPTAPRVSRPASPHPGDDVNRLDQSQDPWNPAAVPLPPSPAPPIGSPPARDYLDTQDWSDDDTIIYTPPRLDRTTVSPRASTPLRRVESMEIPIAHRTRGSKRKPVCEDPQPDVDIADKRQRLGVVDLLSVLLENDYHDVYSTCA